MKIIIDELKTKLYRWRGYHSAAKTMGRTADAREYWSYIKELRAAIKKLETP